MGLPHKPIDVIETAYSMSADDGRDYLVSVIHNLSLITVVENHPVDKWSSFRDQERRLSMALYDAQGKTVTRESLMSALYFDRTNPDEMPGDKIIDVLIFKLRKKLPDGVSIETIWGRGYRMVIDRLDHHRETHSCRNLHRRS